MLAWAAMVGRGAESAPAAPVAAPAAPAAAPAAEPLAAPSAETPPDSVPRYVLDPIAVSAATWRAGDLELTRSVLGRSALARPGVLRLADALGPIPGLRVLRTGTPGSYAALSIRGSSNEQVLVLVDGRRLTTAQGGGVDLGGVDVATLERVEVVRGAASALYGSDAIGGVVNLVTRPSAGAPAMTTARFEGGSHGLRAGSLRHERPAFGSGRAWLRLHGLRSDGTYSYEDARGSAERVNAQVASNGFGLGGWIGASPRWRMTADFGLEESSEGVPGSSEFPTPDARRDDRAAAASAELRVALTDEEAGSGLRLRARVAADRRRRSYVDPLYDLSDRHVNRSAGVDLALAGGREGWEAGAELRSAELESTTDGSPVRQSAGLFARTPLVIESLGPLTVAPAARLDMTSDAEPLLGLRLALARDAGRHRVRLALGNAYRLPSFDDLFAADRGAQVGDPALRPERAREIELGLAGALGWWPARGAEDATYAATVYARRVEDLIQWTPGPDGRYRPHNVGLAVLHGVELELHAPLAVRGLRRPGDLALALTLLDARNESGEPAVDGRRLVYRPAVAGYAEIGGPIWLALELRGRLEATGGSYITAANTKRLPGYALVDLTLERALGGHVFGSLAVLNVGDVSAVDIRDYPLPGREWRLGVRWESPGGER
jgi:vitamin B12 transporter